MKMARNGDQSAVAPSNETPSCDDEGRVVYLTINGMRRKSCARKVQDALSAAKGVTHAAVDFETKQAAVFAKTDSGLIETALVDVVRAVGKKYSATEAAHTMFLSIEGMSCAKNCAREVQQALSAMEGVVTASVDFETKTASIDVAPDRQFDDEALLEVVRRLAPKFNARLIRLSGVKTAENGSARQQKTLPGTLRCTEGVVSASVSFATEKAVVQFDRDVVSVEALVKTVEDVGYEASCTPADEQSKIGDATLLIGGMTYSSCSNSVENVLRNTKGVVSATVNLATEKAVIRFDKTVVGIRTLIELVEDIGYEASYVSGAEAQQALGEQRTREIARYRTDFFAALAFTLPILLIMLVFENIARFKHGLKSEIVRGLSCEALVVAVLATPVQFYSARRFHIDAWKGVGNRVLGMAFLVSMGSNVSYFYGLFTIVRAISLGNMEAVNMDIFMTSSVLISFVVLGKLLEATAKGKTSDALTKLMELQVKSATLMVFSPDGSSISGERIVPIELVQRGDVLKIVRGASVPTDGVVVYGEGRVNESMLTGESKTIKKVVGDRVLGATLNVDGFFHMEVTGIDNDTALSQIIRLVEDAQASKAPIQAYADCISSIFVPVVVGLALGTFVVWYILCARDAIPQDWIPDSDGKFVFALDFGIATLVVACPCALGLATPTDVMVGTGVGAEHGVLIKGGEPLQAARSVNTIIFDKTGTLTMGKPVVTDMYTLSGTLSAEKLVILAGSAELGSEHPLGTAITDYAKSMSLSLEQPTDFLGALETGISCSVGGHIIVIGNRAWIEDNAVEGVDDIEVDQATIGFQNGGKTSIYMGVDGELSAVFAVADAPRAEAARTLRKLGTMGLEVWMVTGDNARTAFTIAEQLGMSRHNVMADVLPSQKASKVKELQDMGRIVAMVGDGINDSPAHAQADLGIAIGGGTDIAVETAGMVLMTSTLLDVITALHLSRITFNRIQLNYVWAFGYNCLLISLAAGVLYPVGFSIPPMFASAAMALSSVSVVVSSLFLRFTRLRLSPMIRPSLPVRCPRSRLYLRHCLHSRCKRSNSRLCDDLIQTGRTLFEVIRTNLLYEFVFRTENVISTLLEYAPSVRHL
ncbi:Copper-transporting ATPase [Phytophthora fragariae]|uniref:P-type Cu(+) transporter n=1 Tax=Phytophthora fragariae TaxID=53985 RepID=A0A6A3SG21_9STRA|nr:Copper-transporting ATPase [Phytophthora fragariae]